MLVHHLHHKHQVKFADSVQQTPPTMTGKDHSNYLIIAALTHRRLYTEGVEIPQHFQPYVVLPEQLHLPFKNNIKKIVQLELPWQPVKLTLSPGLEAYRPESRQHTRAWFTPLISRPTPWNSPLFPWLEAIPIYTGRFFKKLNKARYETSRTTIHSAVGVIAV